MLCHSSIRFCGEPSGQQGLLMMGRRQVVRHQTLDLAFVGSIPTAPAIQISCLMGKRDVR